MGLAVLMDTLEARRYQRNDKTAGASSIEWVEPGRIGRPTEEGLGEVETKHLHIRLVIVHAICGLVFGAAVLHPMAVAICELFKLCGQPEGPRNALGILLTPFNPGMLHGAVAFAVFGFLIGLVEGYFTGVVRSQRDELARHFVINRRFRRELEDQNAALRDLEKMKRRMTQFLVHDLKNHVGCVLGYTRLLLKRAGPNDWPQRDQDALMVVNRQATRMEGAVRDVLELARLEHHPLLEVCKIPAVAVLREAKMASALGPGEGTVLVNDNVVPDLDVYCNPALVVRVMANLVINAVRHNGKDVVVTVGAYGGPNSVVFTCSDTGRGIPDEIRDRLFDEFTSTTREKGSTPSYGLGLAFCKAAVEAHMGRIWFESEKRTGTTFLFAIPNQGVENLPEDAVQMRTRDLTTPTHEKETTSWISKMDISYRRSLWKTSWTTRD
jgi:signal transduction histidine kinase